MIQTTLFPDTFSRTAKQAHLFDNEDVAYIFEQVAGLLEAQGDDYYRIRAYRRGGQSVSRLDRSVMGLYQEGGTAELEKIPNIGQKLALSIEELANTGKLSLLERLLVEVSPEDLFTTVPGIGQTLARRIYRTLNISTLEALEQAAHDDSLARLKGFGKRRVQLVRDALCTMLDRANKRLTRLTAKQSRQWQQKPVVRSRQAAAQPPSEQPIASPLSAQPSVDLLLDIDQQYRYLAGVGQLRMVAPRRFNPENKRWLPVMRTNKGGWSFNVLYSNTARAHDLNKTNDWVVVYYEPADGSAGDRTTVTSAVPFQKHSARQCTIVTETRGARRGQRVIRGMEASAA